jgi:hypothetical protein
LVKKRWINCRTLSFDGVWNKKYFVFWKSFNSIAIFVVLMFFSCFHNWSKIIKLDMSRFERTNFISISFKICFSQGLNENIGQEFCISNLATILGPEFILKFKVLFTSYCWNFCFKKITVNFNFIFCIFFKSWS